MRDAIKKLIDEYQNIINELRYRLKNNTIFPDAINIVDTYEKVIVNLNEIYNKPPLFERTLKKGDIISYIEQNSVAKAIIYGKITQVFDDGVEVKVLHHWSNAKIYNNEIIGHFGSSIKRITPRATKK